MSKRLELTIEDLEDYARGAAFLGTGGGGDPYLGRLAVEQEMRAGRKVEIVEIEDLPDDATVVKVGSIGSPSVGLEKLMSAGIATKSLRKLEAVLGRKVDAVISGEIGGNNATIPLIVSAQTGLPVVNGDGMGRAFPKIDMATFSIYGCKAAPAVLLNNAGESAVLDIWDNSRLEKVIRSITSTMGGGRVTASSYSMTGAEIKKVAVPRTLSLAFNIGRTLGRAQSTGKDPYEALAAYFREEEPGTYFKILFDGKIVDVDRRVENGFTLGNVRFASTRGGFTKDDDFSVRFQNENLVAFHNGQAVATVPDLITIVDSETGEPITTETLKYGQRAKVVGLSCSPMFRTEQALKFCGPRVFGLDADYIPIEDLNR